MAPGGRGVFVVLDGPDGCGKSTQARRLVASLRRRGRSAIHLRDPGSTKLSEGIRGILLDRRAGALTIRAEVLLYLAARAQLVREKIRPALEQGRVVVCERFTSSTIVYQGRAGGEDTRWIARLDRWATGGVRPNLTVILDVAPEIGLARLGRERARDRIERRPIEYHRLVRRGFLEWARRHGRRAAVVDAGRDAVEVARRIGKEVERALR